MKGTAPVPFRVRPEPRRPGKDYRSPIFAEGLQFISLFEFSLVFLVSDQH